MHPSANRASRHDIHQCGRHKKAPIGRKSYLPMGAFINNAMDT